MPADDRPTAPDPAAGGTTNNDTNGDSNTSISSASRTPLSPPPATADITPGSPPPASVFPFLKSALKCSAFLSGLQEEQLHVSGKDLSDLVRRARAVRFQPGDTIIQQGSKYDAPSATPLYIVQSGPSGVYVSKKHAHGGQPVRVGSVKAGEIVGDMALYADTPPSVSVQAEGDVLAWQIDKASFDQWIASRPAVKHSLEQRRWLWQALSKNYLFRGLDDDLQKEYLLSRFEPSRAGNRQPIVQFGEHGDRFYVLQTGKCAIEVPITTTNADQKTQAEAAHPKTLRTTTAPTRALETEEEDIPASSKTGLAGKLSHTVLTPTEQMQAELSGRAWSGENPSLPDLPMVKVAEKLPSECFGEIALLYNVPRCATVRCVSPDGCGLWSVDSASFLSAASKGSLYLKHIFFEHASVVDVSGEKLMNQADFFSAVKHTKWTERDSQGNKVQRRGQDADAAMPHQLNESSLKLMFHLADQSGDNLISFSEFVLLYGLLHSPFTKYQMAFRMFDKDKVRRARAHVGKAAAEEERWRREIACGIGPKEREGLTFRLCASMLSRSVCRMVRFADDAAERVSAAATE